MIKLFAGIPRIHWQLCGSWGLRASGGRCSSPEAPLIIGVRMGLPSLPSQIRCVRLRAVAAAKKFEANRRSVPSSDRAQPWQCQVGGPSRCALGTEPYMAPSVICSYPYLEPTSRCRRVHMHGGLSSSLKCPCLPTLIESVGFLHQPCTVQVASALLPLFCQSKLGTHTTFVLNLGAT